MSEFVEFVYDTDFKDLHNKYLAMILWLPHTLLAYLRKYFQAFTPVATEPKNLRGFMAQHPIDPRIYKEAESLLPLLMDIIMSCVIGDNMGMVACPPSTYPLFFPSSTTKNKSEDLTKEKAAKIPNVTQTQDDTPPPISSKDYFVNSCAEKKLSPHTRMIISPCY